jgi:hypothetical protein
MRLHRGGGFRRWLGEKLGGDFALGDRAWRRIVHTFGLAVLIYYVLPPHILVILTTEEFALLLVGVVLAIEAARHILQLELPAIRPFEEDRIASYVYFAVALAAAVLIFPEPIAIVVVIGTATIDPFMGELRLSQRFHRLYPVVPVLLYAGMAFGVLGWMLPGSRIRIAVLALAAAVAAIAVERPNHRWVDDDLAMTLVPAVLLWVLVVVWPA